MFKYIFALIPFLFFCLNINAQDQTFKKQLDYIQKLRRLSKNNELDIETRILHAKKACELSYKMAVDSVIFSSDINSLDFLSNTKDFQALKKTFHKHLKLARKLKDSVEIAFYCGLLGEHYSIFQKIRPDSSYYYYNISQKTYKALKNSFSSALILSRIAFLQKDEKEFVGSEINSIEALLLLETLKECNIIKKRRAYIYNNLGMVFNQLKQYEKSIEYYNLSLKIKRELEGDNQKTIYICYNNLGNTFKYSGQYDKAIKTYTKVLNDKVFINKEMSLHAVVLDNYAHALYLSKEHEQLPELYLKALRICDSVNADYRTIIIHQHLAEYYYSYNKKDSALYHGYKAKKVSEQFYKDDVLKSLLVLSRIEEDSIAVRHYESYIALNDSIQRAERLKRNKYARIQFETDQYIKETKRLSTQNILISVIGGILLLVLGLLYFIKVQRSKNKALAFASEQEKANQEIYKLMLQQQTRQEEGRLQERHRIAEDLHDGVLSRLFATRMGMGLLNIKEEQEALKKHKGFIEELQDIEREVRDISHTLKKESKLSKTNFESIIESYLKRQSVIGRYKYEFKKGIDVKFEMFNESIRVEIYRIIQEAIQNITKHAQAHMVTISFSLKKLVLEIKIHDDGIGFEVNRNYRGIGLKNIVSRVLKLEGDYNIISSPNKGTELNINIPV
ncbi:tetratricopeptide repeat protein [Flavivirga aquimarina]|uniref:Tetratricopeptide repeat protein n=1 Tax=Flavivirga aquimarina TaxID=2027862 RepID=A0ABT8WB78_9FLAO|nr:tetratricopeptide repeat-containing sensor histidine kinase [Flavivirga aquimarina]MDO5970327.1 tetratricopeptide repeat protein [Flavivirga aquimarina]